MKKLYVPLLSSPDTIVSKNDGTMQLFFPDGLKAYPTYEQALGGAQDLAIQNPKAKVYIAETISVVEARKVEFAEKKFNSAGELMI